jgi:hypothetical protein
MVKKINLASSTLQNAKKLSVIERLAIDVPKWMGTPLSLVIHTVMFAGILALSLVGFDFRSVNIVLTTWLSIEAIYLAIFIQMTVNRHTTSLEDLEEEVEDISEDIEDIQEDEKEDIRRAANLDHIEAGLQTLIREIEILKSKDNSHKETLLEKIQRKII